MPSQGDPTQSEFHELLALTEIPVVLEQVRGGSPERDVRHEAPINRVDMKGLHRWPVAAGQ